MGAEIDLDLIHRVAHGDRLAFERFFGLYAAKLNRFISRLTWRTDIVEETVAFLQEQFGAEIEYHSVGEEHARFPLPPELRQYEQSQVRT